MPPCVLFYPSQTALGYVMQICQHHFAREERTITKTKTGKELFGKCFFGFGFKVPNGTVKVSAFYFIMSLNRFKISVPERQTEAAPSFASVCATEQVSFPGPYGMSLFCLSLSPHTNIHFWNSFSLTHTHADTHEEEKPLDHLRYQSIIRLWWWGKSWMLPSNKSKA